MKTVLYMGNNHIQILTGDGTKKKAAIKSLYEFDTPQGSILNGAILNEHGLGEFLKDIWLKNNFSKKDISLVVDSAQFRNRLVSIPGKTKKIMDEVVKAFDDIEDPGSYYFDYMELFRDPETKDFRMVCVAAERSIVENYDAFFKNIGITLGSITGFISSDLKLMRLMRDMSDGTFAMLIYHRDFLTNTLVINHLYKYSNRNRIFSEAGTDDFMNEVTRNISGLLQFHASEKSPYPLHDIYLAGFDDAVEQATVDVLRGMNLTAMPLPDQDIARFPAEQFIKTNGKRQIHLRNFVPVIGNLLENDGHDVNLLQAFRDSSKNEKQEKRDSALKKFMPIILLAGIIAIVSLFFTFRNMMLQRELDDIQSYTQDAANMEQAALSDEYSTLASMYNAELGAVNSAKEAFASYPKANSYVLSKVQTLAGDSVAINLSSYDSTTGELLFRADAANVETINAFVNRLETQSDLFANVEYSGYAYNEQDANYNINVSCYLSESAGK